MHNLKFATQLLGSKGTAGQDAVIAGARSLLCCYVVHSVLIHRDPLVNEVPAQPSSDPAERAFAGGKLH
jgi:hypothetical protein